MFPGKLLIAGMVLSIALVGCQKKREQVEDNEFSQMPKVASTATGSNDIFDEFYSDETPAASAAETMPAPKTQPRQSVSETPRFSENGRYVVQVSTVHSRAIADNVAAKLNAQGYPAYVADVQNPTPALMGAYYRIRIGGFDLISSARSFGENFLKPGGYDFWVDNRANDNVGIQGYGFGTGSSTTDYQSPSTSSSSWDSPTGSSSYTQETPVQSSYTPEPAPAATAPVVTPETATPETTTPAATTPTTPAPASAGTDNSWDTESWGSDTDW